MKVTVIGGGSTYTPELVNGFITRSDTLPLAELCLMDIAPQRLEVVGGFARRMVASKGLPFNVVLTDNLREALNGSSYVITQLRVGMMSARRSDEYLGKRHGLIGQETTGVGGMAKALRTIPVILDIAAEMRQTAPGALLVNFTNPAGLIIEALERYAPWVSNAGVCNVGITIKMRMLENLTRVYKGETLSEHLKDIDPGRAQLDTLGLNHLTWHRGFTLDGVDVWPQIFEEFLTRLRADTEPDWDVPTIEALGMIPNDYLQYYYYTKHKLAEQEKWPPSRAEEVMQIEADLLSQYSNPSITEPPAGLLKRGGAYYSTLATQLIDAHYNNRGEVHIVNHKQAGAVQGWPDDWVLEMPCRVDAQGVHPLPADPLPPVCADLVAQVKAYELLTVEAGVHGDRQAAYQALLAHPLGPSADQVKSVLDDILDTNKAYLPQF